MRTLAILIGTMPGNHQNSPMHIFDIILPYILYTTFMIYTHSFGNFCFTLILAQEQCGKVVRFRVQKRIRLLFPSPFNVTTDPLLLLPLRATKSYERVLIG